jgi:hypothetical protein
MSNRHDFPLNEQDASREIKKQMRGLDAFIPPTPRYETISRDADLAPAPSDRWHSARMRPNVGAPFALVGIALVALLVLATGAFRTTPSVGPSGSGSQLPSGSVAPSPTRPLVLVPTPTPPSATPSLPPGVIYSGQIRKVAWSPKGTRFAATVAEGDVDLFVRIFNRDGQPVATVNAIDFGWIDENVYIAVDAAGAFVGRIGSTDRQAIAGDFVPFIPVSTAGAAALELNVTGSNQYVIWSATTGLSAPRDGVPTEFSPDGTMLAVVHYPRGCCAGLPSPEPTAAPGPTTLDIVRTDTGKSVRSTGDVSMAYGLPVAFSPDGRMVAFRRNAANGGDDLGILDIATGKVWVVQSGGLDIVPQRTLAWLDATHLDLRSSGPTGPEPAGLNVVVTYWPSSVAAMSASARGDVATVETGQVSIRGSGSQFTRPLPAYDSVQLLWSPDGSRLLVVGTTFSRNVPGQVILLTP